MLIPVVQISALPPIRSKTQLILVEKVGFAGLFLLIYRKLYFEWYCLNLVKRIHNTLKNHEKID